MIIFLSKVSETQKINVACFYTYVDFRCVCVVCVMKAVNEIGRNNFR